MSPKRATAYVGLALVLMAWFAGAGGLSVSPSAPQPPTDAVDTSGAQAMADDLQQQTARLRDRVAGAPLPRTPARNPFVFVARAELPRRVATQAALPEQAVPLPPSEPPLQLIGIAERETPTGQVRTAMLTADSDELFMLVEGDVLGGRYRVKAVTTQTIELTDLVTGAIRRLALQ